MSKKVLRIIAATLWVVFVVGGSTVLWTWALVGMSNEVATAWGLTFGFIGVCAIITTFESL